MTYGVIEDGNSQVDVYEDKLHVSLSDEPVKGLEMSGLDGHPLQSRVDHCLGNTAKYFQRATTFLEGRKSCSTASRWMEVTRASATIHESGLGPN